jgi:hypothetical protein
MVEPTGRVITIDTLADHLKYVELLEGLTGLMKARILS